MKKTPTLLIIQALILILPGCQLGFEEENVFEKDFLFNTFDIFDEEIWQKIDNIVIGLSELRSENVSISNGNLVIKITKTPQTSGGILSKKYFRNGSFSILVINPNTNIVVELEINIPQNFSKAILRHYFSSDESKVILETEILSPYETFTQKFDTLLNTPDSPTTLSIKTLPNSVEFIVNNQKLTNYSVRDTIRLVEVRINTYTKSIDLDLSERNVYIDYFIYQRN